MSQSDFRARSVGIDAYDLGDVVPVEGFSSVSPGTNLLISGPSKTGKQRLALELMAAGPEREHGLAVTPNTAGERIQDTFADIRGRESSPLHVVDCTGATGKGSMDDTETIKYVGSAGDLTGIGMGIVKCTRSIGDGADDGLRLSLLSLSTLLRYSDPNRMFNFLHTVTGRVSAAGYLGVGTLDSSTNDSEERHTLSSLFDVVVELREGEDGSREVRVVGHPGSPRTWQPY